MKTLKTFKTPALLLLTLVGFISALCLELYLHQVRAEAFLLKESVLELEGQKEVLNRQLIEYQEKEAYYDAYQKRGALKSLNRLKASAVLEKLGKNLKEFRYHFSPSQTFSYQEQGIIEVTLLTLEFKALLDLDIYDFLSTLQDQGFIRLRHIEIQREDSLLTARIEAEWATVTP